MAPTTEAAANSAYSLAVNKLVTICNDLDGHLPPFDIQEDDNYDQSLPSVWPRPRLESSTPAIGVPSLETISEKLLGRQFSMALKTQL